MDDDFMKNENAKIENVVNDVLLCVANVARDMKIEPKRARTALRKNAKLYASFRNKKFAKNSIEHKNAIAALKTIFKIA